jgi:hypothetical protein
MLLFYPLSVLAEGFENKLADQMLAGMKVLAVSCGRLQK